MSLSETLRVEKLSKTEIAKKAWITIRANRLAKQSGQVETGAVKLEKLEVKKEKVKTEKEIVEKATAADKKELDELNGVELKKLAKGNGKKAEKNIKKQMKNSEAKAMEIGGILANVVGKIQNVNAGELKKEDQDKGSH